MNCSCVRDVAFSIVKEYVTWKAFKKMWISSSIGVCTTLRLRLERPFRHHSQVHHMIQFVIELFIWITCVCIRQIKINLNIIHNKKKILVATYDFGKLMLLLQNMQLMFYVLIMWVFTFVSVDWNGAGQRKCFESSYQNLSQ